MSFKKFPPKRKDKDCENDHVVPCFTAGSAVITKSGKKLVQHINIDDMVLTRDNGYKPVIWFGKAVGNTAIRYNSSLFSPQHRIIQRIKNEEVLVSANHLVKSGLAYTVVQPVTYIHFMFEQHEIVNVDNIWSESFYPGSWIMKNSPQGKEIYSLYGDITMPLARPTMRYKQDKWVI